MNLTDSWAKSGILL